MVIQMKNHKIKSRNFSKKNTSYRWFLLIMLLAFLILGCEKKEQGPAEKLGEKIDESFEEIKTDAKNAKQKVEDKTEEVINDTERAIEDAQD